MCLGLKLIQDYFTCFELCLCVDQSDKYLHSSVILIENQYDTKQLGKRHSIDFWNQSLFK